MPHNKKPRFGGVSFIIRMGCHHRTGFAAAVAAAVAAGVGAAGVVVAGLGPAALDHSG